MNPSNTSIDDARVLFGARLLSPDDVGRVLDVAPSTVAPNAETRASVPYPRAVLEQARSRGDVLVFRADVDGAVRSH